MQEENVVYAKKLPKTNIVKKVTYKNAGFSFKTCKNVGYNDVESIKKLEKMNGYQKNLPYCMWDVVWKRGCGVGLEMVWRWCRESCWRCDFVVMWKGKRGCSGTEVLAYTHETA